MREPWGCRHSGKLAKSTISFGCVHLLGYALSSRPRSPRVSLHMTLDMEERMPRMTGRCLCGRVQYAGEAEPVLMRACHCKDCQRFTGSAFLTAVAVPIGSITFTGDPKTYTQPGGTTGRPLHRCFCP